MLNKSKKLYIVLMFLTALVLASCQATGSAQIDTNLIKNGKAENDLEHWTIDKGKWEVNDSNFCPGECSYGSLYQEVDISNLSDKINEGVLKLHLALV